MAQTYKELIGLVKIILDTFDETSVASETHLEESLDNLGVSIDT